MLFSLLAFICAWEDKKPFVDETRLRIIDLLVQQNEMHAQDIIAGLGLSQSSVCTASSRTARPCAGPYTNIALYIERAMAPNTG